MEHGLGQQVRPLVGWSWGAKRRNVKGKTWSRAPKRTVVVAAARPDDCPMAGRANAPFLVGLSGIDPSRVYVW